MASTNTAGLLETSGFRHGLTDRHWGSLLVRLHSAEISREAYVGKRRQRDARL